MEDDVLVNYTLFVPLKTEPFGVLVRSQACKQCAPNKKACYCWVGPQLLKEQPKEQTEWIQNIAGARELYQLKCSLSDLDIQKWSSFTDGRFPASAVKQLIREMADNGYPEQKPPEMLTNSWLKLYEILRRVDPFKECQFENNTVRTLHLGEGPGGFICATNHYLKSNERMKELSVTWEWKANSLDAYHEQNDWHDMLDNDLFYKETYGHWVKGLDGTGNLMKPRNFEAIMGELGNKFQAHLVTADGAWDTQHSPDLQEELLWPLLYSETLLGLGLLKLGGTFVIKLFSLHKIISVGLLALIANSFAKTYLAKPFLSKPGNSEIYVIGSQYQGTSGALFSILRRIVGSRIAKPRTQFLPLAAMNPAFLKEAAEIVSMFTERQRKTIEGNLGAFEGAEESEDERTLTFGEKIELGNQWIKAMDLTLQKETDQIVQHRYTEPNKSIEGNDLHLHRGGARLTTPATLDERKRLRDIWQSLQSARVQCFQTKPAGDDIMVSLSIAEIVSSLRGEIKLPEFRTFHGMQDRYMERHLYMLHLGHEAPSVEEVVNMVPGREHRKRYGKWYEDGPTLKPFGVVSSPYFSPDLFQELLKLRHSMPTYILPSAFADFGTLLPADKVTVPESLSEHVRFGPAYDIALLLMMRYRSKEAKPKWLDFGWPGFYKAPNAYAIPHTPASLVLRGTRCLGMTVNLGGPFTADPTWEETGDSSFDAPGGHARDMMKNGIRTRLGSLGEGRNGFGIILIDPISPVYKKEMVQAEIDNQRRLLTCLTVAFSFAEHGSDMIVSVTSTATRFTGSLLLLLGTLYRDVSVLRPPTTSHWSQRKYIYFRQLDRQGLPNQPPEASRLRLVQEALRQCAEALDVDPRNAKSVYHLLPPVLFADPRFATWVQSMNDRLSMEEYEHLYFALSHLKDLQELRKNSTLAEKYTPRKSPDAQNDGVDALAISKANSGVGETPFETYFAAMKGLMTERYSAMLNKLLDMLNFKQVFQRKPGLFHTLAQWLESCKTLQSDVEVFERLALKSIGVLDIDLNRVNLEGFDQLGTSELRRHPSFTEWGFDFLQDILQETYAKERQYFFGGGRPAAIGLLKVSEEETLQQEVQNWYQQLENRPRVGRRLADLMREFVHLKQSAPVHAPVTEGKVHENKSALGHPEGDITQSSGGHDASS